MLPKENRLVDDYDFRRVRRLGRRYGGSFFDLTAAPQKLAGPPRFGFVISTKVDKRATVRNRVKRLLRESVRVLLTQVPKGLDLVLFVKPELLEGSDEEVRTEVFKVLSKVSFARPRVGEKTFSHR